MARSGRRQPNVPIIVRDKTTPISVPTPNSVHVIPQPRARANNRPGNFITFVAARNFGSAFPPTRSILVINDAANKAQNRRNAPNHPVIRRPFVAPPTFPAGTRPIVNTPTDKQRLRSQYRWNRTTITRAPTVTQSTVFRTTPNAITINDTKRVDNIRRRQWRRTVLIYPESPGAPGPIVGSSTTTIPHIGRHSAFRVDPTIGNDT